MKEIYIIEDEILVAKGIEKFLQHNGYIVSGIGASYKQAKQFLMREDPDLILCDINLNGEKTGIDIMQEVYPSRNIPFIFISAYSDVDILKEAEKISPSNYITKPFNEKQLLVSIKRALSNSHDEIDQLPTEREMSILRLISKGYSTKEIASELNIAFNTVETHRKNLIKKYQVKSMPELICLATSKGWINYR